MKQVRITVMRVAHYADLMARYENPLEHACDMREGQVFVAQGWQKPAGFCDSAWETVSPFVLTLACGGEDIYDGWMKDKKNRHDFLQRWVPAGELPAGSADGRSRIKKHPGDGFAHSPG